MKNYLLRFFTIIYCLFVILVFAACARNSNDIPTVTMWGWSETTIRAVEHRITERFANEFNFEFTSFGWNDYGTRLMTGLVIGSDLPDIVWIYRDNRMNTFMAGDFVDLSQPPFNFDINDQFPHLHNGLIDHNGRVVGVEWSLNSTGLAYKRDLAEIHLGTSDPNELSQLLHDWDAFIELGRLVNENSNGSVFMFPSITDVAQIAFSQHSDPIVIGERINVSNVRAIFDLLIRFRDNNIYNRTITGGPSYNATFADDYHIFFMCSTWVPAYRIRLFDPDGAGRWGLMVPPGGGFVTGGVVLAIPSSSENKEQAWEFIRWFLLSHEGGEVNRSITNEFIAFKPLYDDPNFASNEDYFFAGQDIGNKFFNELFENVNVRALTRFDSAVLDSYNFVVQQINYNNNLGLDAAVQIFINELRNIHPELTY